MKILLIVLLGVVLFVAGLYVYAYFGLRQAIKPITKDDEAKMVASLQDAEEMARKLRTRGGSVRVDDSGVGFPKREQELRELDVALNWFQVKFNRLPISLREMSDQSVSNGDSAERQRKLKRFADTCDLVRFKGDSFFVTCDGRGNSDQSALEKLIGTNTDMQKFFLIDGRVILYVPSLQNH